MSYEKILIIHLMGRKMLWEVVSVFAHNFGNLLLFTSHNILLMMETKSIIGGIFYAL